METNWTRPFSLIPVLGVAAVFAVLALGNTTQLAKYDMILPAQSASIAANPPQGDMVQAVQWVAVRQQVGTVTVPGYGVVSLGTHALGKHGVDAQLAIALGIQIASHGGCWECKATDKVVCWSRFTPKGGHEQVSMFIFGLTSHQCITAFLTDSLTHAFQRMAEDGCKNPWQGGHP